MSLVRLWPRSRFDALERKGSSPPLPATPGVWRTVVSPGWAVFTSLTRRFLRVISACGTTGLVRLLFVEDRGPGIYHTTPYST